MKKWWLSLKSLDTGHAERDRHLRSSRYFDVRRYPTAVFTTTAWIPGEQGKAVLKGQLHIRGLNIPVTLDVTEMRSGRDPWGGFRRGFEASGVLHLSDFRMAKAHVLGEASENIRLWLSVEGVRE
jgi:polyisoprenoid-binding protein YceI